MGDPESKVAPHKRLEEAIRQARSLMAYLCERGRDVDVDCIQVIVEAADQYDKGAWTPDLEVRFWNAFRVLAAAAAPVSVESIAATEPDGDGSAVGLSGRRLSRAEVFARRYRWLAFWFLVALLVMQAYWLVGNSLLASFTDVSAKLGPRGTASLYHIIDSMVPVATCAPPGGGDAAGIAVCNAWLLVEVLAIVGLFVLPVLYGLLGALAYVLRQLSLDLVQVTFTPLAVVRYRLRLLLGALAGLSAAWFLKIDIAAVGGGPGPTAQAMADQHSVDLSGIVLSNGAADFLGAAGTWAAAFLAGYSVELLFAALDRMVESFTGRRVESSASTGPTDAAKG